MIGISTPWFILVDMLILNHARMSKDWKIHPRSVFLPCLTALLKSSREPVLPGRSSQIYESKRGQDSRNNAKNCHCDLKNSWLLQQKPNTTESALLCEPWLLNSAKHSPWTIEYWQNYYSDSFLSSDVVVKEHIKQACIDVFTIYLVYSGMLLKSLNCTEYKRGGIRHVWLITRETINEKSRNFRNLLPWSSIMSVPTLLVSHQLHRKRLLKVRLHIFLQILDLELHMSILVANWGSRNNHKRPHLQALPICPLVTDARHWNRCHDLHLSWACSSNGAFTSIPKFSPSRTSSPACLCS